MKGHDNAGDWKGYFFLYQLGIKPLYVQMSFRLYKGFAILEHCYLNATKNTSNGDKETVSSGFPSFYIDKLEKVGFLAYGGWMNGDTHRTVGKWGQNVSAIESGLDSGPLLLFERSGATVLLSPFTEFMSTSVQYNTTSKTPTVSWGVIGTMQQVPKHYSYSTILYYSTNGIQQVHKHSNYVYGVQNTKYNTYNAYNYSDTCI